MSVGYDWISGKVYWTNKVRQTVEVIDPETGIKTVLLNFEDDPGSIPRMIVLDPLERYEHTKNVQTLLDFP